MAHVANDAVAKKSLTIPLHKPSKTQTKNSPMPRWV